MLTTHIKHTDLRLYASAYPHMDPETLHDLQEHLGNCDVCQQRVMIAVTGDRGVEDMEFLDLLGKRKHVTTHLVFDKRRNCKAVVKFIAPPDCVGFDPLIRMEGYVRAVSEVICPGVAPIWDFGEIEHNGRRMVYVISAYLDGARTITEYAAEHSLAIRNRLELFSNVCHTIAFLHRHGVLHLGIKPNNVLVAGGEWVYVLDCGSAGSWPEGSARLASDPASQVAAVYASPEGGKHPPDVRQDVYSLGVLLLHLLAEELPCDAVRSEGLGTREASCGSLVLLCERHKHIGKDLQAIVRKCLERDSDERYGSVGELQADIENVLGHRPILARRHSFLCVVGKYLRRHKVGACAMVVVSLVLVAFLVWLLWR